MSTGEFLDPFLLTAYVFTQFILLSVVWIKVISSWKHDLNDVYLPTLLTFWVFSDIICLAFANKPSLHVLIELYFYPVVSNFLN